MGWLLSLRPCVASSLKSAAAGHAWDDLPLTAKLYVAVVSIAGMAALAEWFPRSFPQPGLFVVLIIVACLTSAWKVNLPIPIANGSTLSVSYAANVMSLILLGPEHAVLLAFAGVLTQCLYRTKHSDPVYRVLFSTAAVALTMSATGLVYDWAGGKHPPETVSQLARPLVWTIATYFLVNTGLVAGAIALSTNRRFIRTWYEDFLWSGASFMVAGTAGAVSAVIVARGDHWQAILLVAPIYLTYRTYEVFVGRLDDQKRHTDEMRRLHDETVAALGQTREAERALAEEKERLAVTLAEMTRLEEQRQHALEREQAARAHAEQANQIKDQFLAVVSHELRTPLNAILGWSDMLRRGAVSEDKRDRASQTIFESAQRQAQLVDDMLDVSRIASGKLRIERTLVDLAEVCRDAILVVKPNADLKRIRIGLKAGGFRGRVFGDNTRLRQVVWNLLSNAVKFTPEGGSVDVELRTPQPGDRVELIVSDTGVGISKEFLPSVFETFRQADSSSTRRHTGLGLGLSIVRSLVEAHGGTVRAISDGEARGATFVVRLPVATSYERPEDETPEPRVAAEAETGAVASLEGVSVLVVDDDASSRDVVAAHLEESHANVLVAASASHAMDVLAHQHVDVLLADIGMPGEDGYSLMRRIRGSVGSNTASVPAAAVTAFARQEDRRRAMEAGFQMHIAKPIDPRALVAAVTALSRRRYTV
jgi:signal transduction histidine kinase/ActR/RegA family two-component response regulator